MTESFFDKVTRSKEGRRLLAQEEFILDVTEQICEIMERDQVTTAELAERLGQSERYVSQLLNGSRNMTLRTLAGILFALDYRPVLQSKIG